MTNDAQDYENYLKGHIYSIHAKLAKHYSKIQKWADELLREIPDRNYIDHDEIHRMGIGRGFDRPTSGGGGDDFRFIYSRVEVSKGLDYVDRIRKILVISCKYMEATVKLFDDFDYSLFAKNDFKQTYHATQTIGNRGYYSRKTIVEDFTPLLKEVDYLRNDFKVLANASQKIINYLVEWIEVVYDHSHERDLINNRKSQILREDPYDTKRLRYAVEYAEELTFDDVIK